MLFVFREKTFLPVNKIFEELEDRNIFKVIFEDLTNR